MSVRFVLIVCVFPLIKQIVKCDRWLSGERTVQQFGDVNGDSVLCIVFRLSSVFKLCNVIVSGRELYKQQFIVRGQVLGRMHML